MFNADGFYSPPDAAARWVLVVMRGFSGRLQRGTPAQFKPGYVLTVDMLGHTNVAAGQGPQHQSAALIEHLTAEGGDMLPMDEVMPLVAQAQARTAAVQAFWAAERAKDAKLVEQPTLQAGETASAEGLAAIVAAAKPAPV